MAYGLDQDFETAIDPSGTSFGLVPVGPTGASGLNLADSSAGGFALDPDEVSRIMSRATVGGVTTPSSQTLSKSRMDLQKDFLSDKSGLQKFLYGLNAFGSGVTGQDSLMDRTIKQQQEQQKLEMAKKQEELNAFKATYGMFDESFKVLRKMPAEKRVDAIQQLAARMDGVSPGAGKAFTSYANMGDPDFEGAAMSLFGDPQMSQSLMRLAGGDEARFYQLITNPEIMKNLTGQVDQKRLPGIVQKMQAIRAIPEDQIPKDLLPKIKKDKEGNIMLDTALLRTVNERLPKELQFTEGDFQTIGRNGDQFTSAGFISPKVSEKIAEKELDRDQWTDPYDLDGVKVKRNKLTNEVVQVTSREQPGTKVTVDMKDNQTFTQEKQLREDFDKASAKFKDMKNYFVPLARRIQEKKPLGPAESLNLTYAYAHALDPASDRITEGDFKRLEQLGSIPQRIGTAIKSVLNGYNLPDDIAREMYTVAARQFKELNKRQRGNEDRYNRLATEYPGLSPERVVTKHSLDDKDSPKPPASAEGKRPVSQIESDALTNGWSDLETENIIRDMHGENEVRKWRTRISEKRLRERNTRGKPNG